MLLMLQPMLFKLLATVGIVILVALAVAREVG